MKAILTPEDKKDLRFISRYLNSLGMEDGTLETESHDSYEGPDLDSINPREWSHFSNNYRVDIPEKLYPILEKVLPYAQERYENIDINTGDVDINYGRVDIDIDTKSQELSISYWFSYYQTGDGMSATFSEKDDNTVPDILNEISEVVYPENFVELRYNGSGDSGYIEGHFEEPYVQVPASVEDYCYKILEDLHGGWEINEGSQGSFYFDLEKKTITLEHQYNYEETETHTLYEESFSK